MSCLKNQERGFVGNASFLNLHELTIVVSVKIVGERWIIIVSG